MRRLVALALVAALGVPVALPAGDAAAKKPVPLKKLCKKKPSKLTKKQRKRCRKWKRARHETRSEPDPAPPVTPDPVPEEPPVVTPDDPATPAPPLGRLGVSAREFSLTLSRQTLARGDALVELQNFGEDPHDLRIAPAGAPLLASFPEIDPNTRHKERVTFAPGTYKLFCSLPGHETLGMRATLTVE
jgi:hypothetical protein